MTPERIKYFADKMQNHKDYSKTVSDIENQKYYQNQIIVLGRFWGKFLDSLNNEEFDELVSDKNSMMPMPESVEKQVKSLAFDQFDLELLSSKWDIYDAPSNYAEDEFIDETQYRLNLFTQAFDIALDKFLEHGSMNEFIEELKYNDFSDEQIKDLGIDESYIRDYEEEENESLKLPDDEMEM